jgi:hypothetical protein
MARSDAEYCVTTLLVNKDKVPDSDNQILFIWCKQCMREEEITNCNGDIQVKRPLSCWIHSRMFLYKIAPFDLNDWASILDSLRHSPLSKAQYPAANIIESIVRTERRSEGAMARRHRDMNLPPPPSRLLHHKHREHIAGCLHSSTPKVIIQGSVGLAKSLYWKHCDGRYLNVCREELATSGQELIHAAKSK